MPAESMMTPDHFRWAEALAIEKLHGQHAPEYVAERLDALAHAGDLEGVARFRAIAARLDALLSHASRPPA